MRKQFDGLYGLVLSAGLNPVSGDVFLFVSRDRKRAKALFWDGNGLNIWAKRMEHGRLADVLSRGEMTTRELALFFEGSPEVSHRLSPEDQSARYATLPAPAAVDCEAGNTMKLAAVHGIC
jgi:transposase